MDSPQDPKRVPFGSWLPSGIAIGVAIGAAMQNVGVGLGIGVALGVALDAMKRRKDAREKRQE